MSKKRSTGLRKNEQGLAAIMLTLFVMLVLSILVLTFSQASRREQRQALDRQLSTDAFYAAESGINTVIDGIRSGTITDIERTKCNDVSDSSKQLDTDGAFAYSCILFDKAPPILAYSSVDTQKGEFVSLQTLNNNLNKIVIVWNKSEGGANYSGCVDAASVVNFSASPGDANCDAGMLRLNLMPVDSSNIGRDDLSNASYTVFLRPSRNGSGATNFQSRAAGFDSQGQVIPADCSTSRCQVTISGMPSGGAVFLLMRSIYHNNAVDIEGYDSTGSRVRFTEAQVKIDSTGRASGVLKRLQVRMPLYEQYSDSRSVSTLDIMGGICKRLKVYPPIVSADPSGGNASGLANNDECGGIN